MLCLAMNDTDFAPWQALGRLLRKHREAAGLSVQQAAAKAEFSESVWYQLEQGKRRFGRETVPPNPRTETIVRAARAVRLDVDSALAAVGREPVEDTVQTEEPKALSGKIAQLNDNDQAYIEGLVDRLLGQTG